MRTVRNITAEEENYRVVEFMPGMLTSKKDPVKPEPEGTIVLMAFRITGYDQDCDGSLMARMERIDKDGETTGWEPHSIGLYEDCDLVVTAEEWCGMFSAKDK
jgi:hypothetical protein